MKLLYFLFFLLASLSANAQFRLSGSFEGVGDGEYVYLAHAQGNQLIPVDSVRISDGKFLFTGNLGGGALQVFVVTLENHARIKSYGTFLLEDCVMNVSIHADNSKPEVSGCPDNAKWQALAERDEQLVSQMRSFGQSPFLDRNVAKLKVDSLAQCRLTNFVNFIDANTPSKVADFVFEQQEQRLPASTRKKLMDKMEAQSVHYPGFLRVKQRLAAANIGGVGQSFIDFSMNDSNGELVKLSDVVKQNRLTLVDFWASWCGPCRMEMPNVRQAYEAYHSKGFQVVGISLDQNRDSWLNAVKSLDLKWLHLSDLKGWGCSAAQLYGVHSIPSCVLINQDGVVVAKDLRGAALSAKLAQLLK